MTVSIIHEYDKKQVFITGITGFKGSWLALLLSQIGAEVYGLGLPQENKETVFHQCEVEKHAKVYLEDLRDELSDEVKEKIRTSDYVFHLAAQPLVSEVYRDPFGTFGSNVMGTVKILEIIKNTEKPITFLNVASDRVYKSIDKPHQETDELAGFEPYSLSKVFSNMLGDMYRDMDGVSDKLRIINARASNVLGGGDKGLNRIFTSIEDAKVSGVLELRNPSFVRPYLYVLDCLIQYLVICAKGQETTYNIGTGEYTSVSVQELVDSAKRYYTNIEVRNTAKSFGFEGNTLLVNTDRFHNEFPEVKSIVNTIDELVDRVIQYNTSDDKISEAWALIWEAINEYI